MSIEILIVDDNSDIRNILNELIIEIVDEYKIPVVFGFPAGHGQKNHPMILGREIEINTTKENTHIVFSD